MPATVTIPATIRHADLILEPRRRRTLIQLVLEDDDHGVTAPTFPPDRLAGLSRAAGVDVDDDGLYMLGRLTGRRVNAIYRGGLFIEAVTSPDGTTSIHTV